MNPFVLTKYAGPQYFCDRDIETNKIINAIINQRNLTLSSLRKMGKTGLIHHVFNRLDEIGEVDTIYLDIYYTESLKDFVNKFGTAVLSEKESFSSKIKRLINDFVKSIRPTFSFDAMSGAPVFSFNIGNEASGIKTLEEIFGFLSERSTEKPLVIAIDEFQQISEYPENNIEALLRTNIQRLSNVNFIFSGSDERLLSNMFTEVKRPFYQSTEFLHLEEIPEIAYAEFIKQKFADASLTITDEALNEIFYISRLHTYYVQFLCNHLYGTGSALIDKECVNKVFSEILRSNETYYSEYRDLLTKPQWNLLIALAKEEGLASVTASAFLKTHELSNPATVRRGIKSLSDTKMIYKKGNSYYVYDVFLAHWLQRLKP